MIIGIGTDVVQIPRIQKLLKKFGTKFVNKYFTEEEILISNSYTHSALYAAYFAKRFAAKEALVKAAGKGFRGIRFKDISITKDSLGAPFINITGKAHKILFSSNSNYQIHLSLSDDYPIALAFVIVSE
ncbi:MAG: holo-ACP synthase [Alphaproteobacteria bacterium]